MNAPRNKPAQAQRVGPIAAAFCVLMCLIGALLGVAMLIGAADVVGDYIRLLRHGAETTATVVDKAVEYRSGRGGGYNDVVYYVFEVEGARVEGREAVGEEVYAAAAPGSSLPVLYEPGNPTNHYLKDEFGIKWWLFLPLTLGGFGLLLLGICGWGVYACVRMAVTGRQNA